MPDISDFHPFVQEALRTGKLPSDEEIARAVGENVREISHLRQSVEAEPTYLRDSFSGPELQDDDEEIFRQRFHQLLHEMIDEWHDDNPHAGRRSIPQSERQRIEDYCRSQIQHQWKIHRQRLTEWNDT
ncbi:hypothetical protein [Mycobacterium sp. MUNTM1]